MIFVPPGAVASKAKTAMLAIVKAIQSAEYAVGNMTIADSVVLSKTEGYIPEDFTKSDVQIKGYLPILCLVVGIEHALVIGYKASSDYLETNKVRFQQALIKECGAQQAPVMQMYLFQNLIQGYFQEQARYGTQSCHIC